MSLTTSSIDQDVYATGVNSIKYTVIPTYAPPVSITSLGSGISLVVVPQSIKSLIAGSNITLIDNGVSVTINSVGEPTYTGSCTTTNSTPTLLISLPLNTNNSSNIITLRIAGYNTGTNQSNCYAINTAVKNVAGVLTQFHLPNYVQFLEQTGTSVTYSSIGSTFNIFITGLAGNTFDWTTTANIQTAF